MVILRRTITSKGIWLLHSFSLTLFQPGESSPYSWYSTYAYASDTRSICLLGHWDECVLNFWVERCIVMMMYPATVASMCEEVRNPVRQVPRAMAWAIPIGFLVGMIFLLPVVFTLPDIGMLLAGEIVLIAFSKLTSFMNSTWWSTYRSSIHDSNGFSWRRVWLGARSNPNFAWWRLTTDAIVDFHQ